MAQPLMSWVLQSMRRRNSPSYLKGLGLTSGALNPLSERRLRAPALSRFSRKATFRNSLLFLQPALYRPRPYTQLTIAYQCICIHGLFSPCSCLVIFTKLFKSPVMVWWKAAQSAALVMCISHCVVMTCQILYNPAPDFKSQRLST